MRALHEKLPLLVGGVPLAAHLTIPKRPIGVIVVAGGMGDGISRLATRRVAENASGNDSFVENGSPSSRERITTSENRRRSPRRLRSPRTGSRGTLQNRRKR